MLPLRYERPLFPLRPTSQFPERAIMVSFWHPGTNELLLRLPANDVSSRNVFGLHHGTALLACEVLAYNACGYLSTSRYRHPEIPQTMDLNMRAVEILCCLGGSIIISSLQSPNTRSADYSQNGLSLTNRTRRSGDQGYWTQVLGWSFKPMARVQSSGSEMAYASFLGAATLY